MIMENFLSITEYCRLHGTDVEFLIALEQNGLLEIETQDGSRFISIEKIGDLERYRIFHYELHVNVEGIDIIENLLRKQRDFQEEIRAIKSRLVFYSSEE